MVLLDEARGLFDSASDGLMDVLVEEVDRLRDPKMNLSDSERNGHPLIQALYR